MSGVFFDERSFIEAAKYEVACYLNGRHGPCSGPLDLHHWISKHTLKVRISVSGERHAEISRALTDDRNLSVLCRTHHERFHNKRFYVKRSELPPAVEDFARDFGLEAWLDRDYPKEAA